MYLRIWEVSIIGYYFATLTIKPVEGDNKNPQLFNSAEILSNILGVKFEEELTNFYEEYPAYIAEDKNYEYVLLGIPEPEYDLSDEPSDDYELQIYSHGCYALDDNFIDVSDHFEKLINSSGEIFCFK